MCFLSLGALFGWRQRNSKRTTHIQGSKSLFEHVLKSVNLSYTTIAGVFALFLDEEVMPQPYIAFMTVPTYMWGMQGA